MPDEILHHEATETLEAAMPLLKNDNIPSQFLLQELDTLVPP